MYIVCGEHLDRAIDDFVEVYETSPDLYLLEKVKFTDWNSPKTCDFCEHIPTYLVV